MYTAESCYGLCESASRFLLIISRVSSAAHTPYGVVGVFYKPHLPNRNTRSRKCQQRIFSQPLLLSSQLLQRPLTQLPILARLKPLPLPLPLPPLHNPPLLLHGLSILGHERPIASRLRDIVLRRRSHGTGEDVVLGVNSAEWGACCGDDTGGSLLLLSAMEAFFGVVDEGYVVVEVGSHGEDVFVEAEDGALLEQVLVVGRSG